MTIALSPGVLLSQAQAMAAMFNGGFINIYTGAAPADPSMSPTGTLLGVVSVNGDGTGLTFAASSAYVSNPPGTRWAFTALASGTAGYFRWVAPADDGTVSIVQARVDGTIGTFDAPGDMSWSTTALTLGLTYTIDSFVYIVHPI